MTAKEKALSLCQQIGITTLFDRSGCNDGMTLPLHISKKIAIILVNEIIDCNEGIFGNYWQEVKSEIENL